MGRAEHLLLPASISPRLSGDTVFKGKRFGRAERVFLSTTALIDNINLDQKMRGEAENGFDQVYSVLEDGLGTDHAKIWLVINGLDKKSWGKSLPVKQAHTDFPNRYFTRTNEYYAHELLKYFFPQSFHPDKSLEDSFSDLSHDEKITKRVKERITYAKNRREIIKADRENNILGQVEFLFGRGILSPFAKYYRVGPYSHDKCFQSHHDTKVITSGAAYRIYMVETFLENIDPMDRFPFLKLQYPYHFDFQNHLRNLFPRERQSMELRIDNTRRKYLRYLWLNGMRDSLARSGMYSTVQLEVLREWLNFVRENGVYEDDREQSRRVAANYNTLHPESGLTNNGVERTIGMFNKELPEYQDILAKYNRKRRIGRMLSDKRASIQSAKRTRKRLDYLLRMYHVKDTSMQEIGRRRDINYRTMAEQRKFIEKLYWKPKHYLYKRKRRRKTSRQIVTDPDAYDQFQKFWPNKTKEELAPPIREILEAYAFTKDSIPAVCKKFGHKINPFNLESILDFLLGEEREYLDYRQMEGFVKLYYRDRFRYLLETQQTLPITEDDWNLLNEAVNYTKKKILPSSEYSESKLHRKYEYVFPEVIEIARRRNIPKTTIVNRLSTIIGKAKEIFGLVPKEVMESIKLRCLRNEGNWNKAIIFRYDKMGNYSNSGQTIIISDDNPR